MPNAPKCPYCGQFAVLTDSAAVYGGRSFGPIWDCRPCDAYVGINKMTNEPLGTLANAELRGWRRRTHEAFDPSWKKHHLSRTAAYAWMSGVMALPPEKAHIGLFDIDQCKRLITLCHPETIVYHHGNKRPW